MLVQLSRQTWHGSDHGAGRAKRFVSKWMGATTVEVEASHVPISKPSAVLDEAGRAGAGAHDGPASGSSGSCAVASGT